MKERCGSQLGKTPSCYRDEIGANKFGKPQLSASTVAFITCSISRQLRKANVLAKRHGFPALFVLVSSLCNLIFFLGGCCTFPSF